MSTRDSEPMGADQQPQLIPQELVEAFNAGYMSPEDARQFRRDVHDGRLILPPGVSLPPPVLVFDLFTIYIESVNRLLGCESHTTRH